ncbi:MAG TPA: phosphoglucosamine mutase [Vicinamibacteria bacterium]|nr:phosphoglucosamine mutase [Vicinamibacteria bacterium]
MSLFGTDGIRGVAYSPPLDRETVTRVGIALARNLPSSPRVLIGRDTRASGPDLERWLTGGLVADGAVVESAGVLTTPAIAFLTQRLGFDAGVVISASHNPYRDNGIKILMASGHKLDDEIEKAIEEDVRRGRPVPQEPGSPRPPEPRFASLYVDHLIGALGGVQPQSLPLVLDCAHGAGYRVGPELLGRLGLAPRILAAEPNGQNINRECGSTHLEGLCRKVVEEGLSLGAALDGDGDRLLLCDKTGRLVDGDAILLASARRLKKEGRLLGDGVVATVMSNMALEVALEHEGIRLHRTQVGDKFVSREMKERNIVLGGEQSGHIIYAEFASTGDGLLTLLQVLRVLALEGKGLDEVGRLEPFPQVLTSVRVSQRPDVRDVPEIAEAILGAERMLEGRGRILVRYSGTEPLLRIMVEGPERNEIEDIAARLSTAVEASIGEPA